MKYVNKKNLHTLFTILLTIGTASCNKDDSKIEYGYAKIYMPQATYSNAANTCDYPVPSYSDGNESLMGNAVANYIVDSTPGKDKELIHIILGVTRSGLEAFKSYSVDIIADNDTVQKVLEKNLFANAVLPEKNTYSLPSQVHVPDGKNSSAFYLTLDKAELSSDIKYAGKKLILAIKIQNSTRYEINPSLAMVMVIISNWEDLK